MDYAINLPITRRPYIIHEGSPQLAEALEWHLREWASAWGHAYHMMQAAVFAEELAEVNRLEHRLRRLFTLTARTERPPPWDSPAMATLLKHLDEPQRHALRDQRSFGVTSQYGNRYCIFAKGTSNVTRRSDGKSFCVVFQDSIIPLPDLWLAQKLLLESDERYFLRIAQGPFPPPPTGRSSLDDMDADRPTMAQQAERVRR